MESKLKASFDNRGGKRKNYKTAVEKLVLRTWEKYFILRSKKRRYKTPRIAQVDQN